MTDRRALLSNACWGLGAETSGLSMRNTSAPRSASIIAQNGPGPIPANSRTRMPTNGPRRVGS